jgi:5-methylthioadenosine/S-adenosylhomocysteine deaminase
MPRAPIDPSSGSPFVLEGAVVTMDGQLTVLPRGRVYVQAGVNRDVLPSDAPPPAGFEAAAPIDVGGTIFPGLIELHNHLSYDALPLWQVPQLYGNRGQWQGTPAYRKLISGPMNVIGHTPAYVPALVRYVEAKCLLGGTTTSQGVALFSFSGITTYYAGIVRNVERTDDVALPAARGRIPDVEANDAALFLKRLQGPTQWLLHLSEGTDASAHKHFEALGLPGEQWAITRKLTGIHCVALTRADFDVLAGHGGSMVWSPLSNLLLYGQTADIDAAKQAGVTIGIGADWSPSGSRNLLAELKIARIVNRLNGSFSDAELLKLATTNAAAILGWSDALGSLESGKRADLLVIDGTAGDPYARLYEADERNISLVMINGAARAGTPTLMHALAPPPQAALEQLTIAGAPRLLDLRQATEFPAVAALTLAQATETIRDGLQRLGELAHDLEHKPLAMLLDRGGPELMLVLDHDEPPGVSIRPHLGEAGAARPVFGAATPLSEIVEPVELDGLTVAGDADYVTRLKQQPNLPDEIKHAL